MIVHQEVEYTTFNMHGLELKLHVPHEVMIPSGFTLLLGNSFFLKRKYRYVCDLGCGSGILSILLAKLGVPNILAVDIDERSVEATHYNAELNGVADQIVCIQSDMFNDVNTTSLFDLIISNPPSTPNWSDIPMYVQAGKDGRDFIDRMISQARFYMHKNAEIEFTHSCRVDINTSMRLLHNSGFTWTSIKTTNVKSRSLYYELYPEYLQRFESRGCVFRHNSEFYERVYLVHANLTS